MAHTHVLHDRPVVADRPLVRPAVTSLQPVAHSLLRIGAGLLFMEHGLQKLFGMLGGFGGHPGATVSIGSMMGFAGVLEFAGGLMLMIGFLTRPVALIVMLEMLYAYATAHLPKGGWPIENGGELALLYALVFFFLATHGSGPWSVDRAWRRRG